MLRNLARDWSAEGAVERAQSYGRITEELRRLFAGPPHPSGALGGSGGGGHHQRSAAATAAAPPSVLVPGAGLGRLCLEIANLVGGGLGLRKEGKPALLLAACNN